MVIHTIKHKMSAKEDELLQLLQNIDSVLAPSGDSAVSTLDLAAGPADHEKVVNGVKSLMAKGYVTLEEARNRHYTLTKEGTQYVADGSPEFHLVERVRGSPMVCLDVRLFNVCRLLLRHLMGSMEQIMG